MSSTVYELLAAIKISSFFIVLMCNDSMYAIGTAAKIVVTKEWQHASRNA